MGTSNCLVTYILQNIILSSAQEYKLIQVWYNMKVG